LAQDDDPIRVDSSIVRLNVGVVDGRGRPVTDLDRANFEIYEDGVKQNIARFEPVATPFSVVIMLDMSGSTLGFRQVIRQSASRFIDALSPNDRVAVVEFYDKINLRNDFTTDRGTIFHSISVAEGRGKTQLYKALDFALDKLAGEKSRRKAIIVLTDGVDTAVKDVDRGILEPLKDDQVLTALKPERSDILNRVLNRADAQGVTIYPLALPTGDPEKLADPTQRQKAMFTAAREGSRSSPTARAAPSTPLTVSKRWAASTRRSRPTFARFTPSSTSPPTTNATANGAPSASTSITPTLSHALARATLPSEIEK
jgi:VWFA-related protein